MACKTPLYILKLIETDSRAKAMYAATLTMLKTVRDSSRNRLAPNTAPDFFMSRQYRRSTTKEKKR